MATAILDKLIQSQFGKSLIMWFFLAMCGAICVLGWFCYFQAAELKLCNEHRILDSQRHEEQKAVLSVERIKELQQIIKRLEEVEQKRKR